MGEAAAAAEQRPGEEEHAARHHSHWGGQAEVGEREGHHLHEKAAQVVAVVVEARRQQVQVSRAVQEGGQGLQELRRGSARK